MTKHTFKSVFGDGGNTAEIELDWRCENCGKHLNFRLVIDTGIDDIWWEAICCEETYEITPFIAVYNKDKV